MGLCDVEVGVLIDVFDVLGVSAVGHADGLLLEDDAVQKNKTNNNKDISCFCRCGQIFFLKYNGLFHLSFT